MPQSSAFLTIECSYQPLDLSFHPSRTALVAAALVDGTVEVHDFAEQLPSTAARIQNDEDEDDTIVSSTQVHVQPLLPSMGDVPDYASCRAVQFSSDGSTLWTGGSEGDIVALDASRICTFSAPSSKQQRDCNSIRYRKMGASYQKKAPIQVIYEIPDRNIFGTGDDAGCVRLWDPRLLNISSNESNISCVTSKDKSLSGCVADWKVHDDYISALKHNDADSNETHTLLATSADGSLSAYDIRMTSRFFTTSIKAKSTDTQHLPPGVVRLSDPQDDELLSLCILKNGKKVVCGTGEGVLAIFSYGTWGDVSDRFPGHPSSVDAILKVDEDTILTGSSDGFIRVVSLLPNKLIGVLGDNHEGFPIEQLQFTCDKSFVGSVTHDNYLRIWDARILDDNFDFVNEDDGQDHEKGWSVDDDNCEVVSSPTKSNTESMIQNSDDEWEDMDEDNEDDSVRDDDSDSSEEMEMKHKGRNKGMKNVKRASRLKSERERFFDDL
jgi:WD repeat-containing protein 55